MQVSKENGPGRAQTIALARKIIQKYEGAELSELPEELLLAKGVMAMYGQMLREKSYNRYDVGKYKARFDEIDWEDADGGR